MSLADDPIIARDEDMTHADNGAVKMSVLDGGRVFKRRAIKKVGTPQAEHVCWLVAELDGVRVYVNGEKIVVSRQDLYP